jgi:LDH2 family malate/lactate/ureidoglycolate dehydrogenase
MLHDRLVEQFVARLKQVQATAGSPGVLIPGEPERRASERRRQAGIPITDQTWDEIVATARRLGVVVSPVAEMTNLAGTG